MPEPVALCAWNHNPVGATAHDSTKEDQAVSDQANWVQRVMKDDGEYRKRREVFDNHWAFCSWGRKCQ